MCGQSKEWRAFRELVAKRSPLMLRAVHRRPVSVRPTVPAGRPVRPCRNVATISMPRAVLSRPVTMKPIASPARREIRRGTSTAPPQNSRAPEQKPAKSLHDADLSAPIPEARMAAWAGLVPFIAGAAASLYLPTLGHWGLQWSHYLMWVQMSYGACVLSFLGAVHWGLALAPNAEARRARIMWSVLPSLWAAAAQAVPPLYGAPLLIVGFLAALAADSRAQRAGLLPAWYLKMRIPITMGVVMSLGTSFIKLL